MQEINEHIHADMAASFSIERGRTEVYFWGMEGSGKTSVIGSVVAVEPLVSEEVNGVAALNTLRRLSRLFNESGHEVLMNGDVIRDSIDPALVPVVINADIRDRHGRLHPLALVEMADAALDVALLPKTDNDKIHILCYDCSRAGKEQDDLFTDLLGRLHSSGILSHSVGVYLLVTKIDSLHHIPKDYRNEFAQTLITAQHLDLWMCVRNVCFGMKIKDVTPIPYSVGDVTEEGNVVVNLDYARSFIEKPLALKSHTYRSVLGRVLSTGSWWTSALLIIAVCAALGYGIHLTLAQLAPIPDEHIRPFDYVAYFERQEAENVRGGTYYRNRSAYESLCADLKTERFITLSNGKRLLHASEYTKCDETISNDYAELIHGGMAYEFKQSEWNDAMLEKLGREARQLLRRTRVSEGKKKALDEALDILDGYEEAKDAIRLSHECSSQDDVDYIEECVEYYDSEPYTNNLRLQSDLHKAVDRAYVSLARSVRDEARSCYTDFISEWDRIDRAHSINIFAEISEQKALQRRTLDACDSIVRKINHLDSRLSENEDARQTLSEARGWLDKIRDKKTLLNL